MTGSWSTEVFADSRAGTMRSQMRCARPSMLYEEVCQPRPRKAIVESQAMKRRDRYVALFALIALIIAAPACSPSKGHNEDQVDTAVAQTPGAVASATASPVGTSPTDTRASAQPTPTLTGGPELFPGLHQEVYFGGLGGLAWEACELPPGADLPAIEGGCHSDSCGSEFGHLCLFGFPLLEEEITVALIAPEGDYVASEVLRPEDWPEDFAEAGDGHVASVWCPAHLPTGEWRVVASSRSAYAEGLFTVDFGEDPQISDMPDLDINPLEGRPHGSYSPGEQVIIVGSHFEPNMELPLGIYYDAGGVCGGGPTDPFMCTHTLVHSEMVTTDNQGRFHTSIVIDSSYAPGWYNTAVAVPYPDDGSWHSGWRDMTDGSYFGRAHVDCSTVGYWTTADNGFVLIGIPYDFFCVDQELC